MNRFCKIVLGLSILTLTCIDSFSQQVDNQKYFLGEHCSSKPDTSIKRELIHGLMFGDAMKLFNFNSLHQFPWNFNIPEKDPVFEFNLEYISGKPSKIYFCTSLLCGFPDNNNNPFAENIYAMRMLGYSSVCASSGHCFAANCKHPFLNPYLSVGLAYNASMWKQNGELAENTYILGDFLMHLQLMLEYPKGLYLTSKKLHSTMDYLTFAVKLGYDVPLQQVQQIHLYNSQSSPNFPSFNMGGYFVSFSINIWTYRNKELWNNEMHPKKN
jgi:hypothetical protein